MLATSRPLAVVLVTCTAIALVGWMVQVAADAGGVRNGRSAPVALIEEASFAVEDGIHLTALAAGARFRADANGPLGLPFRSRRPTTYPARRRVPDLNYADAMPGYVLWPALVILMGSSRRRALRGFAAARAVKAARSAPRRWGAVTGPAWAVTMAFLVDPRRGPVPRRRGRRSVFGVFLIGGALLGAGGGAPRGLPQSSRGNEAALLIGLLVLVAGGIAASRCSATAPTSASRTRS